jgi:hypothetical protein
MGVRFVLGRWLAVRGRKAIAVTTALVVAITLTITGVVISAGSNPATPSQRVWASAAGQSHRASASSTQGRLVNGRVVSASSRLPGPVAKPSSARLADAVPATAKAKALHFPVTGKSDETLHAKAAPAASKVTGYNAKTSKQLPLSSADQVTYTNADGTKTAFDFQTPVNYRLVDGKWASIDTSLGPAPSSAQSASTTAFISSSPSPAASLSPTPSASPSPSAAAAPSSTPSGTGWTERGEAEPATFASVASSSDVVSRNP